MKDFKLIFAFGAAMALVVATTGGCSKAVAQEPVKASDRSIELTVYKDDFAMVSERRPVDLGGGRSKIQIDDVSKQLDPDSVLFDWPNAKSHPDVVSTTYNLGVGNGNSLMSRLNGEQVKLMWPSQDGKAGEMVEGKLEASSDGSTYALRTPDKLYVNPGGTIVASPKTTSTLPQLSVELNSSAPSKMQLGVSYLTRGMAWSADYVAKLNPGEKTVELECWATIINKTGIPFPSARLTLMAGEPNRMATLKFGASGVTGGATSTDQVVINGSVNLLRRESTMGMQHTTDTSLAEPTNVPRTSVGDLYAYKIPSTATIGVDQLNRVSMLGNRTVPVKRSYGIQLPTLTSDGFMFEDATGSTPRVRATVALSFVNDGSSNLGIPLPAGSVRIYEKDETGRERYTGADSINDTAKKEHVSLTMANAFDVYGSYRVLKSEKIDKHKVRKTVEAILHNEKKNPVDIRVVQTFGSRSWPVSESVKSDHPDATTTQWKVSLKPGEAKTLTYTVDLHI